MSSVWIGRFAVDVESRCGYVVAKVGPGKHLAMDRDGEPVVMVGNLRPYEPSWVGEEVRRARLWAQTLGKAPGAQNELEVRAEATEAEVCRLQALVNDTREELGLLREALYVYGRAVTCEDLDRVAHCVTGGGATKHRYLTPSTHRALRLVNLLDPHPAVQRVLDDRGLEPEDLKVAAAMLRYQYDRAEALPLISELYDLDRRGVPLGMSA